MKKTSTAKKATLPPGIVAYKGAGEKAKRWLRECGEPDNLASGGSRVKFRQAAGHK